MASSEYGNPEESEPLLEEAAVYKATSSSDYVVLRRVRLYRSKFITYHNIEENEDDNKQWILTSQCELQPRTSAEIKEPGTKYVRPRGQWAITTLVKPKSIGTKGKPVRLYMFTLSWPTRWATLGYTSFAFGFETAEAARHWHSRLAECLESTRLDKAGSGSAASVVGLTPANSSLPVGRVSTANGNSGPVPRVNSAAPTPSALAGVSQTQGLGSKMIAGDGTLAESRAGGSPLAGAKRALQYDNGPTDVPVSSSTAGSSFARATAAAAAAAGVAGGATAVKPRTPMPPPAVSAAPGVFCPSSSDSEDMEDESDGGGVGPRCGSLRRHGGGRGSNSMLGPGSAPCRGPRNPRSDVRRSSAKQRWVPYKQVNGVAIYHRPQTAGDAEAGMGGEFMVSTVVRGSPRTCLTSLLSRCGNTTVLGPATMLEVLERRQAVDGKEIQRIILQAPGVAGVICAPRELVVETVFKTDETGPTLVLMFNSCEPPARFVERRAGLDQAALLQQQQEEREAVQAASEGSHRSWWRQPVSARVRGGYTFAPLEEYSLDNSPEALVTCIMKVDLGGVCGERSWLRLPAGLVGWTDAFLDRMLMAVTLLRDEVEQGRFVVQPLSMMATSTRVKERDGSAVELNTLGASRSMDGPAFAATLAPAAGGGAGAGAGGGAAGALARRSARTIPAGRGVSRPNSLGAAAAALREATAGGALVRKSRRRETDHALPADATAGDRAGEAADGDISDMSTAPSAGDGAAVDAVAVVPAEGQEGGPLGSRSVQLYETMDDVLLRMRSLSFLDTQVWDNLHQPGKDAPFKIRGPTYLKDRKKIPAGYSRFVLGSMDVIELPPGPVTEHVARFIPAIRQSGAPFSVIIHLVIPGTPLLGIVATFVSDRHPSQLGPPPAHPMEDEHDWEPFDFVLHKYMTGSTHTRNHMLKLIPHIADGSWMIKQSVGTTPVILGKQLRTIYYETPQYIEIDIDISANNVASYVTGLVRGATRSLVIDMGFVLEGTTPWELPEALLGTLRLYNLDIKVAQPIDVNNEIPLRPPTLPPPQQPAPPSEPSPPTEAAAAGPVPPSGMTPLPSPAVKAAVSGLPGSSHPSFVNIATALAVGGCSTQGIGGSAGGAGAAPVSGSGMKQLVGSASGVPPAAASTPPVSRCRPSASSETPRTSGPGMQLPPQSPSPPLNTNSLGDSGVSATALETATPSKR